MGSSTKPTSVKHPVRISRLGWISRVPMRPGQRNSIKCCGAIRKARRPCPRQSTRCSPQAAINAMNPLEISSDQFQKLAEHVTKLASQYLENIDDQVISPATNGAETLRRFRTALPEPGMGEEALNELPEVMRLSRAQNGRFLGYVLGSGEPVAAAADFLASVLNQNVTAWRSGPAAVVIEQTVIGWLAQAIGCSGFRGHLTCGGSSANLVAFAIAREAKAPANEKGVTSGGIVYASDEIHMSIPKSVALLGIGRDNLHLISTDDSFRMIPEELEARILADKTRGKTPLAVVASAGTVSTGSIDPL